MTERQLFRTTRLTKITAKALINHAQYLGKVVERFCDDRYEWSKERERIGEIGKKFMENYKVYQKES